MADTKISGLAAGAPAQATDLIPIARSGANYSITPANILAYGTSPVAGTTGTFTGALSATTGAFSGTITNTKGADAQVFTATGAGTGYSFADFVNTGGRLVIGVNGTGTKLVTGTANYAAIISSDTNTPLVLASNATAIATVSSTGLAVTGTLSNSTDFTCGGTGYVTNMAGGTVMNVKGAQAGGYAMGLQHTNANPVGMYLYYSTDTNDAAHPVVRFDGATNTRYQLFSNGGISNYQANDTNLSDVRTKKNIEPAGNYLDKICAIPVKTFLYKDQTDEFLNLGVIAQDVESVAPELIDSGGFGDTPEDGVPLKSIYQTDLQFALMKAIQELAAKVAALESK